MEKQQRFVKVHQRLAENRQEMERLALEDMEAYKKVSEAYRNKQGIDESLEVRWQFRVGCADRLIKA